MSTYKGVASDIFDALCVRGIEAYNPTIKLNNEVSLKKPYYGGAYRDLKGNTFYIKRVIYSKPATIVFWSDNTKTIAKCDEKDHYNQAAGLTIAVLKKIAGVQSFISLIKDWVPEKPASKGKPQQITLADVRKAHKNDENKNND